MKNLAVYGYTVVKALLSQNTVIDLKDTIDRIWDTIREERYSGRSDRIRDKLVYNLQNGQTLYRLAGDAFCQAHLYGETQ